MRPLRRKGWLAALRDAQVGRTLAALHARPADAWTLEAVACEAGQSRIVLDERFAALTGQPPMQHLARWPMRMAARRLAAGAEKVAAIAADVGSGAEPSFNRAFKRLFGAPAASRRSQAAGTGSPVGDTSRRRGPGSPSA